MKMKFQYFIIYIFLFLFSIDVSYSQSPYFRKHPLPLEYKNVEVHCILQDKNNFLWLGTTHGLIRFNGINYKHFLQFNNQRNEVSALYEDSRGLIWIGYRDGRIGTINSSGVFAEAAINSRSKEKITAFAEDKNHRIWASTYGEGLRIIDGSSTDSLTIQNGLSDNFIYSITADDTGKILAGTDVGLSICSIENHKKVVSKLAAGKLPDNIVTQLKANGQTVWLGFESSGVSTLTGEEVRHPLDNWTYGRITALLVMGDIVWAGTAMNGVIEIDLKHNRAHQIVAKGLPKKITGLFQDREGNIWICNGTSVIYSGNMTFSFVEDSRETVNNIQAILYAKNNIIWYSTTEGVYSMNLLKDQSPIRLNKTELAGTQVISLQEDNTGKIWMGTFDKGVMSYNPTSGRISQLTEKDGLINNNVLSIAYGNNSLWFATLGGVSEYKQEGKNHQFKNYTSENGLGSNYIYKVFIDSKKRIWFATDGKGVTVLEKGKFKTFSLEDGLKSNIIYSLTEDASGQIWLSTANAGIYRWNADRFQSFVPHNGLRDLAISSIIGDKHNNILLVSKNGIDILDPKTGAVFYHGDEFGIAEIDPNLNAYTIDSEGNIWLGTQNGIVKYNTSIRPMQKWPVTTINEVQLLLSKADTLDKKFSHDDNHVSFDYFGFWYHDPAEVSYKLKLQGYDREWIYSKNHFITYPNLPPGDYKFIVQSSATNHFEGAAERTFSFHIAPPFYNTIWFYALSIISVVGFVYWYVKKREQNLKAHERLEKEKIEFQFQTLKNQVNPHFLFNSFNTLIGVIEQDQQTAVEYVEKLSDFYRDILLNREKDLITLHKELEMIDNYYFLQLKRYRQNLTLKINIPDNLKDSLVAPLTLQLLVENAIKHNVISSDIPLTVEIFEENNCLVVRNNLQRKSIPEPSTGLGLHNIMNRYKLLSDNKVHIAETDQNFSVYVPLLKG
jgi:ligand-binding sensor domain-containing protein